MHRHSGLDIVLHDHGDGSRAMFPIFRELYRMAGLPLPFANVQNDDYELNKKLRKHMRSVHLDIVSKFKVLTQVLQTKDALYLLGKTYVSVRASEKLRYCEFRFAPQYHTFGGLTIPGVLDALIEGIKEGEKEHPEIEVNVIACVGREVDPGVAVGYVHEFCKCKYRDILIGVDLACDESSHPAIKHVRMYRVARAMEFKITCHAGEWASNKDLRLYGSEEMLQIFNQDTPLLMQNIRDALWELHVNRVSHATALGPYLAVGQSKGEKEKLLKYLLEQKIGIEGCPASNMVTQLIPDTLTLRIRTILDHGIYYTLNPDDDLFMPTLEKTFEICNAEYHFTAEESKKLRENAWDTRFGRRKYKEMPPVHTAA